VKYLLDTSICVFVIRQKPQLVVKRFRQQRPDDLAISTVTLAELRYGADKSSNAGKNHAALDLFLAPLEIASFDAAAAEGYGQLRADLERRGVTIGPLDTMIAAHALSLKLPLITNNIREFSRVPGLIIQDWTVT